VPSFQVVEVPVQASVPPPSESEEGAPYYPLVEKPADELAEECRRRLEDAHLLDLLDLPGPRKYFRNLQPEKRWQQCLLYPLLITPFLIGFAPPLALATVYLVFMLPAFLSMGIMFVVLMTLPTLLPLTIFAYGCGFLQGILNTAVAGMGPSDHWPGGRRIRAVLRYVGRWLYCFLVGPALLAAGAVLYWINAGALDALDWLILLELAFSAIAYWLFALLAVTRSSRLVDANPRDIAVLIHRLGYQGNLTILGAALLALLHLLLLLGAVRILHESPFQGWLLLSFWWFSVLTCAAALFRLAGRWCYLLVGIGPLEFSAGDSNS
jgi:hypothetical protein